MRDVRADVESESPTCFAVLRASSTARWSEALDLDDLSEDHDRRDGSGGGRAAVGGD